MGVSGQSGLSSEASPQKAKGKRQKDKKMQAVLLSMQVCSMLVNAQSTSHQV